MERLFVYGTLRYAGVQTALFGREVVGFEAVVLGWRREEVVVGSEETVRLSGDAVHPILRRDAAGQVDGVVLELTLAELARCDAYEVEDYVRHLVELEGGESVWAYVSRLDV